MHRTKINVPMQFRSWSNCRVLIYDRLNVHKTLSYKLSRHHHCHDVLFFVCASFTDRNRKKDKIITERHGSRRLMVAQEMERDTENTSREMEMSSQYIHIIKYFKRWDECSINFSSQNEYQNYFEHTHTHTHRCECSRSNKKIIYI